MFNTLGTLSCFPDVVLKYCILTKFTEFKDVIKLRAICKTLYYDTFLKDYGSTLLKLHLAKFDTWKSISSLFNSPEESYIFQQRIRKSRIASHGKPDFLYGDCESRIVKDVYELKKTYDVVNWNGIHEFEVLMDAWDELSEHFESFPLHTVLRFKVEVPIRYPFASAKIQLLDPPKILYQKVYYSDHRFLTGGKFVRDTGEVNPYQRLKTCFVIIHSMIGK